jgi:class 3 adenylate cyclase
MSEAPEGPDAPDDGAAPERERGFLLIADMESSTASKFVLGEAGAFSALREHNRLIMERCRKTEPVHGIVLNSLGDAVVAKFPITNGAEEGEALAACLRAARDIVRGFEALDPIEGANGRQFYLRTKLTLQLYDAYRYGRREGVGVLAEELVGPDIDLAFRLSAVSWRLQVLATERFMNALLERSVRAASAEDGEAATEHGLDCPSLLERAHLARHVGALGKGPLEGISEALTLNSSGEPLDYWLTDAREIGVLKGIPEGRSAYLMSFESPTRLIERGLPQRLTIKVRQDHHAVILASVEVGGHANDNYIEHVVQMLRDSNEGSRLDSELTLCAAAKIYGEFDFFFRVSCIDDTSLRRFFDAIHDDAFGVSHVEVHSTLTGRFAVTPHYDRIFDHYRDRPYELVLAWFERSARDDLFARSRSHMERGSGELRPVEILETGEVIHRRPVYAILICESLRDYAAFFTESGLRPTSCRSHIGHIDRPADAQLRYSLMSSVYVPRRPGGFEER